MNNVDLYKKLTLEIIQCLKEDNINKVDDLFEKRENILKEEKDNKIFKESMINIGIIDLDKEIRA